VKVVQRAHGQYSIACNYFSRALVEHAKAVPGMRFDGPSKEWYGYADAVAAVCARLKAAGLRLDSSALPAPDSWRTGGTPFLFATKNLREYQVEGVRFLIAKSGEGALLADGMRLGKSAQSLTASRAFKQKTLIVCPSHVVGVWGRPPEDPAGAGEIAKWWPDAWLSAALRGDPAGEDTPGVVVLEGVRPKPEDKERLAGAMVIVCSYDILYAWVDVLKEWGLKTLIVDECHAIASYKSRRSGAIADLAGYAKRRIFLSGTPMTSRPRDLHNVLDTLCPGRFGYFFTHKEGSGNFSKMYCNAFQKTVGSGPESMTVWDFSGASNLSGDDLSEPAIVKEESLHDRLSYLMLRRVKSEVDSQLPPKTRQVIDVKIPPGKVISVSGAMLADRGVLRRALDLSADGKLKSVVSLLRQHAEEGEKVIGFCYRRLFAEALCRDLTKAGVACAYVHGGLSQKARDARIEKARKFPGPFVLCATIDTTSTGIDLSFSSVAVFGELSWEPHELAQAEERVYRFGAGVSPLVQYVIAKGTGDELIVRAVISKLDDFEKAIGKTGDRMKEDLAEGVRGEAALRRLAGALAEMQAAVPLKARAKAKVAR
jgi:SNF2 family DNA or RNA helicase